MLSVYDLFLVSGLTSEEKKRDFQQFMIYIFTTSFELRSLFTFKFHYNTLLL